MKVSRLFFALIVLSSSSVLLHSADPAADARKRMMERTGGGAGLITPAVKQPQAVVSYITYVSPMREWVSADGRKMHGRLVAFSAPKPGETGPVEVIKDGKVRLVRSGSKKPADFPLQSLSEEDQIYARRIEESAKKMGAPEEPAEGAEKKE